MGHVRIHGITVCGRAPLGIVPEEISKMLCYIVLPQRNLFQTICDNVCTCANSRRDVWPLWCVTRRMGVRPGGWVCDQLDGWVTSSMCVWPIGWVCVMTSRMSVWPGGWVCDQEDVCVTRRMGVWPGGWACDHAVGVWQLGWVCGQQDGFVTSRMGVLPVGWVCGQ